jgi:hypothetical protein
MSAELNTTKGIVDTDYPFSTVDSFFTQSDEELSELIDTPTLEEGFIDKVLEGLETAIENVAKLLTRLINWVTRIFTFAPKSVAGIERILISSVKLSAATDSASRIITSSASSIDESLSAIDSSGIDKATLRVQLLSEFRKPLLKREIAAFTSRNFLKEIIGERIELYTEARLRRIVTPFIAESVYRQYGLMAANLMNNLLSDYRTKVAEYIKQLNTVITEFRNTGDVSEHNEKMLDDIFDSCDASIKRMVENYMIPFGRTVFYGKKGDGVNHSSPATVAKTLRHNVNGLLSFMRERDDNPANAITFSDLQTNIVSFRQQATEFKTDHGKEIAYFLQAMENSVKSIERELSKPTTGQSKTKTLKLRKNTVKALSHLMVLSTAAKEICRVYNGFLELSLSFVNAYADITNYKHREIQAVLNYYADITTGFKKKALEEAASSLMGQRVGLQTFVSQLNDIIKRSNDTSTPKGNFTVF